MNRASPKPSAKCLIIASGVGDAPEPVIGVGDAVLRGGGGVEVGEDQPT